MSQGFQLFGSKKYWKIKETHNIYATFHPKPAGDIRGNLILKSGFKKYIFTYLPG